LSQEGTGVIQRFRLIISALAERVRYPFSEVEGMMSLNRMFGEFLGFIDEHAIGIEISHEFDNLRMYLYGPFGLQFVPIIVIPINFEEKVQSLKDVAEINALFMTLIELATKCVDILYRQHNNGSKDRVNAYIADYLLFIRGYGYDLTPYEEYFVDRFPQGIHSLPTKYHYEALPSYSRPSQN
jgi:hypothetical protein